MKNLTTKSGTSYVNATQEVLTREMDGVTFYTDERTGASGISQSGLAILCGVNEKSVRNALNSIRTCKPFKTLESLVGRLDGLGHKTESGVMVWGDEVCVAIIRYYAFKVREKPSTRWINS